MSDYLTENKERNKKGEFDKTDVLSVSGDYGVVNQIELLGRSFAGASVLPYHVVRHGNIVYTKSPLKEYPYGIVKANTGVDGIVSTLYAVYNIKNNVDAQFIEYYFSSANRTNRYFKPIVRIGAKHDMKIGNQEVLANKVTFPNLEEQTKIASLFRFLDERIATQNKIIDKLQSLIKGIVDCTILRKEKNAIVGDVCSISEQIRAEANIDDIITVRLHGNGVCKSSAENLQLGATQYYRRRAGQLIYGKQNFHNGAIGIVPISLDNGITSKDIPSFDIDEMKCNSVYLLAQLQSPQYYKPAEALTTGTGSKRLKEETFLKMPIVLPNKREQDNIAVLIHRASMNLDHAKRLLELLSIQKQFLLRQMFI